MQGDCQFSCNPIEPKKRSLCKHNSKCVSELKQFLQKQILTKEDRDEVLIALSDLFLFGSDCVNVCLRFVPFALEVMSTLALSALSEGHSELRFFKKLAVVMSRGFLVSPEIMRYALDFVMVFKPFIVTENVTDGDQISDLDWCRGIWSYIEYLPQTWDSITAFGHLNGYLSSTDGLVRWYAYLALCIYYRFTESETAVLLLKYFTSEEQRFFTKRVDEEIRAVRTCLYEEGAQETTSLLRPEMGDFFEHMINWYSSLALWKYYSFTENEKEYFLQKYFTLEEQRFFTKRVYEEIRAARTWRYKEGAQETTSLLRPEIFVQPFDRPVYREIHRLSTCVLNAWRSMLSTITNKFAQILNLEES